ncbi:MAG: DUF1641 domain-containing protein [Desulfurococcales archaeon]|nr:DUF1641 domain-containing protein [Desulfurococcales archaeon]
MAEKIIAGDFELEALKELLEVAVELKKSGILGMLKSFLSEGEEALAGLQRDPSLLRLGVLLGALFEAARRLEAEKTVQLKMNVEDASYCLFNTLAEVSPAKAEPKGGIFGLMGVLRDPDVQKGLGYLIAMAKSLGACMRRMEGKA